MKNFRELQAKEKIHKRENGNKLPQFIVKFRPIRHCFSFKISGESADYPGSSILRFHLVVANVWKHRIVTI